MPSNHLNFWCPLLPLPSVFPSIRDSSSLSAIHIRWPKYWSFSFSISPSYEYSGLISLKIDWFDFLAVQGTPRSLLQYHNSKALENLNRWIFKTRHDMKVDFCIKEKWTLCSHFWALLHASLIRELHGPKTSTLSGLLLSAWEIIPLVLTWHCEVTSSIISASKYLLDIHYVPGPVLASWETPINKETQIPKFMKHGFWDEEINNKHNKKKV